MAKQKKPVHRVQMTEGKRNIIHQLLEEYDIQTAEDIQDALKDLLGILDIFSGLNVVFFQELMDNVSFFLPSFVPDEQVSFVLP